MIELSLQRTCCRVLTEDLEDSIVELEDTIVSPLNLIMRKFY